MLTDMEKQSASCSLCALSLPSYPILDGENTFCCAGCHAVFTILLTKNLLHNYQETTLFQQAIKSGLISNPALLDQIRQKQIAIPEQEREKLHLEVSEMWCPACAEIIKLILLQEKGVLNCVVDYATDLASVEFSPRYIAKERIYSLIGSLGYKASALNHAKSTVSRDLYLRFAVAAFCSLNIMMFAYPLYASFFDLDDQGYGQLFAWISLLTAIPVVTYSAWPIFQRFISALRIGLYGMETLVVIGVSTSFGLSIFELYKGGTRVYFDSMVVIITLVLLGKIFETKAKYQAKSALIHLVHSIPRRGRKRFLDGSQKFVPIKEIIPGDIVTAFSGEKIVLDGMIIEGQGSCDESLMTGEAMPIHKKIGSMVLGGAFLQSGSLAYRVTGSAEESVLSRIIEMVQQEIGHKSLYVRAADRIVRWFVPSILLLAFVTGVFCWLFGIHDGTNSIVETAFIRAISVLLISCPCAIGIAAPLAEAHLMNQLARLGVIVRNRGCLADLGREAVFVFDKTGTVTAGKFSVLQGLSNLTHAQRALLKGLAAHSTHPVACAIVKAIEEEVTSFSYVEEIIGKGLRAGFHDSILRVGSADFMREQGVIIPDSLNIKGTKVFFAQDQHCLTVLEMGDEIRPEVKVMLKELGLVKKILLSGDSADAVAAVAKECGFDSWQAGFNPLQKREFIETLREQGNNVCMVGDGINDAPALAAATIGISVVVATDISIQVSDLLLTTDSLKVLPAMRKLALKGHQIIKQNLFWAFFYNVIGLGLAAYGILSPLFAASAMVASSLMVLFNARRI